MEKEGELTGKEGGGDDEELEPPDIGGWNSVAEWLLAQTTLVPRPANPLDSLPKEAAESIVRLPEEEFEAFMEEFLGREGVEEWRRQMDDYAGRITRLVNSWRERGIL